MPQELATDTLLQELESIKAEAEALRQENGDLKVLLETTTEHADLIEIELEKKNILLREIFGRYLTSEVVTTLLEAPDGLRLGGVRRRVTLLTSDLRGFTDLAERLQPEEVIKVLNLYLGRMADVITSYQGTIDEFMGDGILVFFGVPIARPEDATRAVACAIAMQLAMAEINAEILGWGLAPLGMGVAIHTGDVVVGNIGSEKRAKYGVVGSAVNLTFRIESYTTAGQVLISQATLDEAGPGVEILSQRQVQPKGIPRPLSIYEVGGLQIPERFALSLPRAIEPFIALPQAVPVSWSLLDGKDVSGVRRSGRMLKLARRRALLASEDGETLVPPAVIKLTLVQKDGPFSEDIYAKVIDEEAPRGVFCVEFTTAPPSALAALAALREAAAAAVI